ncbi:MAG: ECF transporter S component [Clostridia bacterium]|nr:ECF transporter S component [Clostridia bacterium]
MGSKLTFTAKQITGIAILIALVIVLQALGGSISIGVVQLNFTLIPIVLGGILFGSLIGALTGFVCGVVVLIQVIMGIVPFYTLIWAGDPVVVALTCILKTTVAGFLCGYIYNLIAKKNKIVATFVASAIVPIVNTTLFVIGCLFMTNSVYGMAGSENVLTFILVSIVTFNFFIELAINLVVAPALNRVFKAIHF